MKSTENQDPHPLSPPRDYPTASEPSPPRRQNPSTRSGPESHRHILPITADTSRTSLSGRPMACGAGFQTPTPELTGLDDCYAIETDDATLIFVGKRRSGKAEALDRLARAEGVDPAEI